jgi:hypothetical protein
MQLAIPSASHRCVSSKIAQTAKGLQYAALCAQMMIKRFVQNHALLAKSNVNRFNRVIAIPFANSLYADGLGENLQLVNPILAVNCRVKNQRVNLLNRSLQNYQCGIDPLNTFH